MRKIVWVFVVVAAILVSNFAVAYYAHFARPKFDETLLGLWGFRSLACGRGSQVVVASGSERGGFDVKEGFLGHAQSNGASDQDIEYLAGLFEDGREAAMRSGFKEGVKLDAIGTDMTEIITSLVDSGCGVDMHFLMERGWFSLGGQQEEIMKVLLNQ